MGDFGKDALKEQDLPPNEKGNDDEHSTFDGQASIVCLLDSYGAGKRMKVGQGGDSIRLETDLFQGDNVQKVPDHYTLDGKKVEIIATKRLFTRW